MEVTSHLLNEASLIALLVVTGFTSAHPHQRCPGKSVGKRPWPWLGSPRVHAGLWLSHSQDPCSGVLGTHPLLRVGPPPGTRWEFEAGPLPTELSDVGTAQEAKGVNREEGTTRSRERVSTAGSRETTTQALEGTRCVQGTPRRFTCGHLPGDPGPAPAVCPSLQGAQDTEGPAPNPDHLSPGATAHVQQGSVKLLMSMLYIQGGRCRRPKE